MSSLIFIMTVPDGIPSLSVCNQLSFTLWQFCFRGWICTPGALHGDSSPSPESIWPCLETFLVVTLGQRNLWCWWVEARGTAKQPTMRTCTCAKSLQSCPTLCDPMHCSLPGFSVHGDSPGKILECVAMPSSRGSSQPRDWPYISYISCIDRQVLYH